MSFGKPGDNKEGSTPTIPTATRPMGTNGGRVEAFLGEGCKVVGTLHFNGPVEIDGTVEGEIRSQDRLTIGESATINAKIQGSEVLVMGTVNGDITASKKLSLRKPAKVIGNITCSVLSIEEGVVLEGKCSMDGPAKSQSTSTHSSAAPKMQATA